MALQRDGWPIHVASQGRDAGTISRKTQGRNWLLVGCLGCGTFGIITLICLAFIFVLASLLGAGEEDIWTTFHFDESGGVLLLEDLVVSFDPGSFPSEAEVQARLVMDEDAVLREHSNLQEDDSPWLVPVSAVYDVHIPSGLPLGATVVVSLPYSTELLGESNPEMLAGASWNGHWWVRWPSTVNHQEQTVTFIVDHFSKVAVVIEHDQWRVETRSSDFTAWETHTSPSERFTIEYKRQGVHAVLPDKDYISPLSGNIENPPAVPLYVRDLAYFLDDAGDQIGQLGYTMPPRGEPIIVRIQNLNIPGVFTDSQTKWVDGATGAFGPIYIDSRLYENKQPRDPSLVWQQLLVTATHEFYHVVQRYNPSFPAWFYEASAVYLEWRLFEEYFPGMVARDYIQPSKAFLERGMWSGKISDHYAKAAFLIYLEENYSSLCNDIILEGFHTFGGSAREIYAANLKHPDMRQAFLGVARRCGNFEGSWNDLFAEFATRYYVDWDAWPTASWLVDSALRTIPENYNHSLYRAPVGSSQFPAHRWPIDSSALWRISASGEDAERSTPPSTLVLHLLKPGMPGTPNTQGTPRYWIYPLSGRTQQPAIGPTYFDSNNPTVAVYNFGDIKQGAAVDQVYLVGVNTPIIGAGGADTPSFLQVIEFYLLPMPYNLSVNQAQTDGEAEETLLEVRWAIDAVYFPSELRNLNFRIFTSNEISNPLQQEVAVRGSNQNRVVRFTATPDTLLVSVVLEDSYGNHSPVASTPVSIRPQAAVITPLPWADFLTPGTYRGEIGFDRGIYAQCFMVDKDEVPPGEPFTVTIVRTNGQYSANGQAIKFDSDGVFYWAEELSGEAQLRFTGEVSQNFWDPPNTIQGTFSGYHKTSEGTYIKNSCHAGWFIVKLD
jgi:hypothetical protein